MLPGDVSWSEALGLRAAAPLHAPAPGRHRHAAARRRHRLRRPARPGQRLRQAGGGGPGRHRRAARAGAPRERRAAAAHAGGRLRGGGGGTATGAPGASICRRYREALAKGVRSPAGGGGRGGARPAGMRRPPTGVASYDVLQCRRVRLASREGPFDVVQPGHVFVLGTTATSRPTAAGWGLAGPLGPHPGACLAGPLQLGRRRLVAARHRRGFVSTGFSKTSPRARTQPDAPTAASVVPRRPPRARRGSPG